MPNKRTGTGFTGLQTYLGLNQGSAGQMGNRLANAVEGQGRRVEEDLNADYQQFRGDVLKGGAGAPTQLDVSGILPQAASVQNSATALRDNTGRATLLGKDYGQGTWGGGQLDAALAGAGSAGRRLNAVSGAYSNLLGRLRGVQDKAAAFARDNAPKPTPGADAQPPPAPEPAIPDSDVQDIQRDNIRRKRERNPYL